MASHRVTDMQNERAPFCTTARLDLQERTFTSDTWASPWLYFQKARGIDTSYWGRLVQKWPRPPPRRHALRGHHPPPLPVPRLRPGADRQGVPLTHSAKVRHPLVPRDDPTGSVSRHPEDAEGD
jgi:hypothetical protein